MQFPEPLGGAGGPDELRLLGLCSPGLSAGSLAAPGARCVTAESQWKHALIYQTGERENLFPSRFDEPSFLK